MKRVLWIVGIVIGLLAAAALVVPFLVPNEVYRSQIERSATQALGRNVTLTGDVGLSIFPSISARVDGVAVANPDGFSRENMIEAGALRGVVKWGPLLGQRVEIAEIVFEDADVQLERRADGTTNWTFGGGDPAPDSEPGEDGGSVSASIDRASLSNARLAYFDETSGAAYEVSELDLTAEMRAMDQPVSLTAAGLFQGQDFDLNLNLGTLETLLSGEAADMDAEVSVAGGDASYRGQLRLSDEPELDGSYSVSARALQNLADLAGIDIGYNLALLGNVRAEGRLTGPLSALKVTFDKATIDGDGIEASYTGDLSLGETLILGGTVSAETANLPVWLRDFGVEAPSSMDVLEELSLSATLNGPVETLSISEIDVSQAGPMLNASYTGAVSLDGQGRIEGEVVASSDDLRTLLTTVGVELAPGETLEQFDLSGNVSGALNRIVVSGLNASLDDVSGSGGLTFDLRSPRPSISGELETGVLDLSPFLGDGEGETGGGETGWSDAELNLEGLRAVDTNIGLKADEIIIGDITLAAADLTATLDNGDFNAAITRMTAFGGTWDGTFGLDASQATPALDINLTGETIQLETALMTFASLDSLSGIGELGIDLQSTGNSPRALVAGLQGTMNTNIANGALKGLNIGQLVRSQEAIVAALAARTLDLQLEPEAETDFTSMLAGLELSNGVATISKFSMDSPVIALDAGGSINILNQTLDLSIVPTVDTTGQSGGSALQLNGVPIPFKISGDWMSPQIQPDIEMLQATLRADAVDRVEDQIRDQIGGELGGVIGGILGSTRDDAPIAPDENETTEPTTETVPPAEEPQSLEEQVEDRAREEILNAIGGLFGGGNRDDDEEETEEPS